MALVTTQGLSATLPISEANVTNLTADLATLTTAASAVQWSPKNLSSAQLLALDATPIQLLAAPGGRNYYVVHALVLHYRFVTTPYNENVRFALKVGYGSTLAAIDSGGVGSLVAPLNESAGSGDLFKSAADAYVLPPSDLDNGTLFGYIWNATDIENKALSIGLVGASLTGGDGTLTVRTLYSLIDGAP